MADPNSIADIFNVTVQFVPVNPAGRFGFGSPTFISEFAANVSFTGRIKSYTGTVSQKLALLVADGFSTTSDAYKQVQTANLQDGPARTIYVGRADAGDADWGEAVAAIKAEADVDGLNFYAFTAATRDVAEIEAIADYLEGDPDAPVFAFYLAQTNSAAVYNNTAGNVAQNILDKDYRRTALLWHDPEVSSGYGPAILESAIGPFNIPHSSTISFQIDGGATQTFTFLSVAATLLGSIAETYSIADGDTLIFTANSGASQTVTFATEAATILSLTGETYDISNGDTLSVRVDGAAAQTVTFAGTAGALATTTGAPWVLANGETITFSIDGGTNQVVTLDTADFVTIAAATAAELAAVFTDQLTGVTVSHDGTDVTITSDRLGTSSDVEVVSGTAGLLVDLGYIVGNNVGTGFAAFLDAATASEVAAEINADTTDCVAADDDGFVRITSNTVGTVSRIQVAGGTANAVLGFDTNEVAGSGDFVDASVATALEVVTVINANVTGVVATVDTAAVRLTSTIRGTSSQIDVAASTIATTLGLSLTAANGTGDFANAALATAAEMSVKIAATLTDAVASSASSKVKITSDTSGLTSTVEAVDGTLLTSLKFVDAVTAISNLATGTGVLEDFCDAAWMGRCITFDLDKAGGAALWNNHELKGPSPTGVGAVTMQGDIIDATTRELLHDTLFVNTYEPRLGRNATHFGTVLNSSLGAGVYIDILTTGDWLDARITEAFARIDAAAADKKTKYPYAPSGIAVYANGLTQVLNTAETNGHTFYDGSPLDLDDPQSTGVFIPTVGQQTQVRINQRAIDGFRAQQLVQGGIQRGSVIINLIGPTAQQ
jgi:hypothetical protein